MIQIIETEDRVKVKVSIVSSPEIGVRRRILRSDLIVIGDELDESSTSPPREVLAEEIVEAVLSDSPSDEDAPLATRVKERKRVQLEVVNNSIDKTSNNNNAYCGRVNEGMNSSYPLSGSQQQSGRGKMDCISDNERDALERVEASELGETILEWARELEYLRAKCGNLQGRISGRMKLNITRIQEGVSMLVSRVAIKGDPTFLRIKNKELEAKVKELTREKERLEERARRLSPCKESSPLRKHKIVSASHVEIDRTGVPPPEKVRVDKGRKDDLIKRNVPREVLLVTFRSFLAAIFGSRYVASRTVD